MPITVSMKVVFQTIPDLNRWAELMSVDWQSPAPELATPPTASLPDGGAVSLDAATASTVVMKPEELAAIRDRAGRLGSNA